MNSARPQRISAGSGLRAFTLAELITVIGVVSLLAALALPALSRARAQARTAQCVGQLRQISLGMRLYAEDDPRGLLPSDRRSSGDPAWVESLAPHLGNPHAVATCPADPFARQRRQARRTSYVLNQFTSTGGVGTGPAGVDSFDNPHGEPLLRHAASQRLDGYDNPAETFLTFEASNVGVIPDARGQLIFHDHSFPDTWPLGWAHVLADIDPCRHGKAAAYIFADGHVATVSAESLRRRIEQGDNFAAIRR